MALPSCQAGTCILFTRPSSSMHSSKACPQLRAHHHPSSPVRVLGATSARPGYVEVEHWKVWRMRSASRHCSGWNRLIPLDMFIVEVRTIYAKLQGVVFNFGLTHLYVHVHVERPQWWIWCFESHVPASPQFDISETSCDEALDSVPLPLVKAEADLLRKRWVSKRKVKPVSSISTEEQRHRRDRVAGILSP